MVRYLAALLAILGAIFVPSWFGEVARGAGSDRPSARAGHSLVYDDQRKMVLLIDGYQPPVEPQYGEIWGWNGTKWVRIASDGLAPRLLSGVAYDSRRNALVIYGGIGNISDNRYGDTWEWNGRVWEERRVHGPGSRDHHAMVYDAARGKVVVYGGTLRDGSAAWPVNTWEWDGTQWARFDVPGPGARVHHAMAYDAKRRKIVLFGGFGEDGKNTGDTWAWDGASWRQVTTTGPPPRARHRMAYDGETGTIVLYGGNGVKETPGPGFNVLDDTWMWDGSRWTQAKAGGLGKRFAHAMAYDAARRKILLYGGQDGDRSYSDLWEWDGKNWRRLE